MTNRKITYRWSKIKDGIGSIALVTLDVEQSSTNRNQILEHYCGRGFTSQVNIEEIPTNGYDSWKIAARHGLEYAFSLVGSYWTVNIYKIEGRIATDTNATIVGYTVLRAFLDRINYLLTDKQINTLEEFVLLSRTNPDQELIPNFFDLTFAEYTGY